MSKTLENIEDMKQLAQKLESYKSVSKFDSESELEAWRLVHSLAGLEHSFGEILDNYIPALCDANDEQSVNDALLDIGEELRHILYHVKDPKYFNYLLDKD